MDVSLPLVKFYQVYYYCNENNKYLIIDFCIVLIFFPAASSKEPSSAVIICPGGAYWALAIEHEGWQVAEWLNSLGISAFVLKYRLPHDSIMADKSIAPLQDAQKALAYVSGLHFKA